MIYNIQFDNKTKKVYNYIESAFCLIEELLGYISNVIDVFNHEQNEKDKHKELVVEVIRKNNRPGSGITRMR